MHRIVSTDYMLFKDNKLIKFWEEFKKTKGQKKGHFYIFTV